MDGEPRLAADRDPARTEAFSDGVFAIAMTLLVLQLKVPRDMPPAQLGSALFAQWPAYGSLLLSFTTIGIMWLNHHRLFMLIRRATHGVQVLNGLLLFTITIVPFPTALLAEYLGHPGETLAAAVYSGWYLVVAVAFNALWRHVASPHRQPAVLRVSPKSAEVKATSRAYLAAPVVYGLALVVSFWQPLVAVGLCSALALFVALPPKVKATVAT